VVCRFERSSGPRARHRGGTPCDTLCACVEWRATALNPARLYLCSSSDWPNNFRLTPCNSVRVRIVVCKHQEFGVCNSVCYSEKETEAWHSQGRHRKTYGLEQPHKTNNNNNNKKSCSNTRERRELLQELLNVPYESEHAVRALLKCPEIMHKQAVNQEQAVKQTMTHSTKLCHPSDHTRTPQPAHTPTVALNPGRGVGTIYIPEQHLVP